MGLQIEIEQQHRDRAAEWVAENCPDLGGDEYEDKVCKVARELAELDAAEDRVRWSR